MTIEMNTIHQGDCLKFMKDVPDDFFDLLITDPPYGIGIDKNKGSLYNDNIIKVENQWDENIPSEEYFREMFRITKNQIIWGGNYMTPYLTPKRCWIIWHKLNDNSDYADCEMAWTSFDKGAKVFTHRWDGWHKGEGPADYELKRHPTQKPAALGRYILKEFAILGQKIFDPFAGSGTFLVAAKQLGIEFVGCEIEPKYCGLIRKRLGQKKPGRVLQIKNLFFSYIIYVIDNHINE